MTSNHQTREFSHGTNSFNEQIIKQELKQHVPKDNAAGSEMHHKLGRVKWRDLYGEAQRCLLGCVVAGTKIWWWGFVKLDTFQE